MRKWLLVSAALLVSVAGAGAASVDKSIDLKTSPETAWKIIGPFCAIKDWHPAIGDCVDKDGVRTLTTKDGKAQFVEKQTARDEKAMTYSYEIEKSPLPVTGYKANVKVVPTKSGATVEWSSTYTPDKGKEQAAAEAITRIYQDGLDNIQKLIAK